MFPSHRPFCKQCWQQKILDYLKKWWYRKILKCNCKLLGSLKKGMVRSGKCGVSLLFIFLVLFWWLCNPFINEYGILVQFQLKLMENIQLILLGLGFQYSALGLYFQGPLSILLFKLTDFSVLFFCLNFCVKLHLGFFFCWRIFVISLSVKTITSVHQQLQYWWFELCCWHSNNAVLSAALTLQFTLYSCIWKNESSSYGLCHANTSILLKKRK